MSVTLEVHMRITNLIGHAKADDSIIKCMREGDVVLAVCSFPGSIEGPVYTTRSAWLPNTWVFNDREEKLQERSSVVGDGGHDVLRAQTSYV